MEFEERELSFEEAERRHADLERRRDAGQIGERAVDDERRQLMVRDAEGRWWAKDREANEWYYYEEEPPWIVLGGDKPPVAPGEADGWYDYGWIPGVPPCGRMRTRNWWRWLRG